MNTSAPKRYAHALIRHFILISLFFPAYYSKFQHVYYQDMTFMTIVALLFSINIWLKWRLDFRKHGYSILAISAALILYLIGAVLNYKKYPVVFWRTEPFNILIAFLFFITLLIIRDEHKVISDKVIRFAIYAILIHNGIGIIYRLFGGAKFYMQTLYYEATTISEASPCFSWMYYDASEYALILLLSMAFLMTYKRLFKNNYFYWGAQTLLIICMLLTQTSIYYLATLILFGGNLLYQLIKKYKVLQAYELYSYPVVLLLYGVVAYLLLHKVGSYLEKLLIWEGTWDILRVKPEGLFVGFGYIPYEVPGIDVPLIQAQNTFLNHMLRHSLGTGILFAVLILVLLIVTFMKKPNYRSLGIMLAILIPMNMEFGLQSLHLPYVLFLMYAIFYRKGELTNAD